MKARIAAKIPEITERVLSYAVDDAMQPLLSEVLQELKIDERRVSDDELNQYVGYLAGISSFSENPKKVLYPQSSYKGFICMCGLSNERMDLFLKILKQKNVYIPIKSMLTVTNQNWCFGALIEELTKEHEAILQQQKNTCKSE